MKPRDLKIKNKICSNKLNIALNTIKEQKDEIDTLNRVNQVKDIQVNRLKIEVKEVIARKRRIQAKNKELSTSKDLYYTLWMQTYKEKVKSERDFLISFSLNVLVVFGVILYGVFK